MFCIGFTKRRPNQVKRTCYAESSQIGQGESINHALVITGQAGVGKSVCGIVFIPLFVIDSLSSVACNREEKVLVTSAGSTLLQIPCIIAQAFAKLVLDLDSMPHLEPLRDLGHVRAENDDPRVLEEGLEELGHVVERRFQ
ncbi:hypothetical protein M0R45_015506 [Rubus argutus]|uniref:Uncharacterized protein n=1 Tax=Rubus argutus TaxID=59490 RepID=A0AAW1XRV0_RUBAR